MGQQSCDVLRRIYSYTVLAEGGVSRHRNASEQKLGYDLVYALYCTRVG